VILMQPERIRARSRLIWGSKRIVNWVVNCAGINKLHSVGKEPPQNEHLLVYNVMPIYWVINALVAAGHGPCRVLSIASQTHRIPQTNTALYCASKAALVMLTKVMARELAPNGLGAELSRAREDRGYPYGAYYGSQVRELRGWTRRNLTPTRSGTFRLGASRSRREVVEAMFGILTMPSYVNGACIDMTGGA
jgi:NAD(P)-dependent dehydrogenase (short-subunit alcohol dehydrogenase family)